MAKKTSHRRMNVYSNLSHKRKSRKNATAKRRAEYLASLPKHPVKRMLHRMHPKRVAKFWFSKRGAITALKLAGVGILLVMLLMGGVFAYYRKDIDQLRPGELAKNVQTTVTKYYDRNDKLLWEDKGSGDYRLVVDSEHISENMRLATIAIEDKDFYSHNGISVSGLTRAFVNNTSGQSTQGGSTLTQQLVKQVFFADEAQDRGLGGIPRKIKEVILSIEVERMYNKEEILNLYLNESPYGGRRNGVESAAQTYFGKHAEKLNLAESAFMAAIPNQPGLYNPYNVAGNQALVARQHQVLDNMADQKFITKAQADKAKKVNILDTIKPETSQYKNIKAPHFVQMVRSELETQLGDATVGRGGLIVKTTLDLPIQNRLEKEMDNMFKSTWPAYAGFTNGAATLEDVKTGQVIAMMGSRDFNYSGYGQDNAATAFIQPGSSIKPLVYAQLFEDKGGSNQNFGSGSILSDVSTDFGGGYKPQNADSKFKGNIDVRLSLATSRNIPAIKAMQVSGVDPTLQTIRAMGDKYYCTQGAEKEAGLSSAIGGCGSRMIDHTNAMASLARNGTYMPHSTVLKVTNSNGETLKEYKKETDKVISPQSAYIVSDILSDNSARQGLFGRSITPNLDAAGIKAAIKTGTSDKNLEPKDIWTIGYTPHVSASVWLGNPDTSPLVNGNSSIPAQVLDPVMAYATQLYEKRGDAKAGDWITRPKGLQVINGELFPSWYNKEKSQTGVKLTFDRVSKKRATDCTPSAARIEVYAIKMKDPISKKTIYLASDGYDANSKDDKHKCEDAKPSVDAINIQNNGRISVMVSKGTNSLDKLTISVDGRSVASLNVSSSGRYSTSYKFSSSATVTATVRDDAYYEDTGSQRYSKPKSKPSDD